MSEQEQTDPVGWRRKAFRWWYILRYHRPSQLVMRLVRTAEIRLTHKRWAQRCSRPLDVMPSIRDNPELTALSRRKLQERFGSETSQRAERIAAGRYEFLHQEHTMPGPVDWRLAAWPGVAHLWRFHLHYHEFLLDLAAEGLATGRVDRLQKAWAVVLDWIEHNRLDDPRVLQDAWHPYCISRRLPVWIHLWLASPPDAECRQRILTSMLWQARYLQRHLEWDVRGNHLLENLRAMVLIAGFLAGPEADRWLSKASTLLERELAEQILPHGEHFERSPMYHAQMVEAVLDVRDAVAGLDGALANRCHQTAAKMAHFLHTILHPDGHIPLLGDSCLDQRIPSELNRSTPALTPTSTARQLGDYWVYRHRDDFLLFDAGPVGPAHLPAHAHADLLSLEASIHGRRLFVDSGVYNYADDPMRRYCRPSAAHNVLQIDGHAQCDLWSRFRMGYRGWPSPLVTGHAADFAWARATHNAYRRLGVPVVGRWLACRPGGPWFCVDWAQGRATHELTAWLHLHPEVTVRQVADAQFQLLLGDTPLRLQWLTPGLATLAESWYCPQLGLRQKASVIRWQTSSALPAASAWCLTWAPSNGTASLEQTADGPVLQWTEPGQTLRLEPFCRSFSV